MTTRAYTQLKAAQDITIANNKEIIRLDASIAQKDASIAQKDASIAQKDASIAQKDASIAQKDASIAQKDIIIAYNKAQSEKYKQSAAQKEQSAAQQEQQAFLIGTTESIRTRLLPLLAEYIGASPEKQKNIRDAIIPLAKQLREAEKITEKVQPLTEENRLAKE